MKKFWSKRNKIERWALGLTGGFVTILMAVTVFFQGAALESYLLGDNSPSSACLDARNSKLPYCQEAKFKKDSEWRELNRYSGGKANAFTLYRK